MIAVVGPGDDADPTILADAERVGELLARAGHAVVTGGLGGVMAAASRGASRAGGRVVALLPGTDRGAANEHADVVVATGLGQGRNALVVRSADAIIGVGGSWGTLSEIAMAMRVGTPVVWLHGWQIDGPSDAVPTARSAEDAVATVTARLS